MSKQLLQKLNGNSKGAFHKWLNAFNGEPRIAWYPSAGEDFRDLLYLNPKFSNIMPANGIEPVCPDLFLHSDYYPWSKSTFLDSSTIYQDLNTIITVKSIEELPRCDLPLDDEIVSFPEGSDATGRILFLEIDVFSSELGVFSAPVIYAFVENAALCSKLLLPNNGKFSHVIHVRYGGGCGGGGKSTGIWLLNVLRRLGCECLVTDSHYSTQSGDKRIYEIYPDLAASENMARLEPIRLLSSEKWSGYGDVSWNIVRPA